MKLYLAKYNCAISAKSVLACLALLLASLTSCHTTEENYKASYEKAVEKTKEGIGSDTYAKIQAEKSRQTDVINGDSVRMYHRFVGLIDVKKEDTKRFNVILREFKQLVNARSMRNRLIDEGHNSYILFYSADKAYYVVVEAFDTKEDAAAFLVDAKKKIKMNVPLDNLWILDKL